MAEHPAGPTFPVQVDERELAEDLAHMSEAGRAAVEAVIQSLAANGVPADQLKQCDSEARDGTRLPGCVNRYIPQPAGQWGAVFLGAALSGAPTLFMLAVGDRRPGAPWKPSAYEIAHRRLRVRRVPPT